MMWTSHGGPAEESLKQCHSIRAHVQCRRGPAASLVSASIVAVLNNTRADATARDRCLRLLALPETVPLDSCTPRAMPSGMLPCCVLGVDTVESNFSSSCQVCHMTAEHAEAAAIVVDAAMLLLHCLCNICPCACAKPQRLTTATMIVVDMHRCRLLCVCMARES